MVVEMNIDYLLLRYKLGKMLWQYWWLNERTETCNNELSNIDLWPQLKLTHPVFISLHCTFFAAICSSDIVTNRWNIKINFEPITISFNEVIKCPQVSKSPMTQAV